MAVRRPAERTRAPVTGRAAMATLWAWLALLAVAVVWGARLNADGVTLGLGAPPFVGRYRWPAVDRLLLPGVLAAVAVVAVPRLAFRLPWRAVPVVAGLAWVGWVLALASIDGWDATTATLAGRYDYLAGVDDVTAAGGPGGYLSTFTERALDYPVHVRVHPPGPVLGLWALDRIGFGGIAPVVVVVLAGGAAAVAAVLVAVRSLSDEDLARRAAPFLALSPAAVFATNLDLVFAGAAATGLAVVVRASEPGRSHPGRWAAAGGAVLGVGLLCSYGLALFALPVLVVLARRGRLALVVRVGAAALVVVALPALWGFWWIDGALVSRDIYWRGLARVRPAGYFVVANLAAFGAVLGPVTLAAAHRLRHPLRPLLVGVGVAVLVALTSQMSKGEVERIWQPFAIWLTVTAVGIVRPGAERRWLGLHAASGLTLAAVLASPW